jgi:hypothetical protein
VLQPETHVLYPVMHDWPHELTLAMHDDATSQLVAASDAPSPAADPSRNLSKSCVHPHKTIAAANTARTKELYLKSGRTRRSRRGSGHYLR